MTRRTLASIAGMALIAACSFGYMYRLGISLPIAQDLNTVSMALPDSNGLVVGSPVLLRGIRIGEVSTMHTSAGQVSVEWRFDSDYRVPTASRFRVDNLSALGESFIAVVPPSDSGPYLTDDAVIDPGRIVVPTTIKELSARLTRLLEQIDPARVGAIFRELDIALPEDTRVLGGISRAGELLADMITTQSDAFARLLTAVQPILRDSSWLAPDLVALGQVAPALGHSFTGLWDTFAWTKDFQPIVPANRDGTQPFMAELQKFLDTNATDLRTLGTDLLPAAQAAAASMRTVDVGRVLAEALSATEAGDSVTVHVRTPGK
ncbi:MlaD family protein [Nocardia harenae]|uniref:MlaD family protein n=1 Tax=Nocardia harenae TaxID=358707 RepID=UPI000A3E8ED9|nr:MlaD family protein [Nocardia harenae]